MSRTRLILLAGCLFLLIVGARWALFDHYGTDLPEADQWDGEGMALLLPWSLGTLHWQAFLAPHNEHRIVLTRALAWALTVGNGQWDQRLEAGVLALLPAAIAVLWWRLAARRLEIRWQIALFLLLAATFALPVAWQNILTGFASAQFFLIGWSIGAVATLPFANPLKAQWWLGAACLIFAAASMATGFFAAGIVGGLLALQLWRGERSWSTAAPGLALCTLIVIAGIASRTVVPQHEVLKAHSLGDFGLSIAKALGWPAYDFYWGLASLLLFLPWALVAARMFDLRHRSPRREPWSEFLSGLGLWVLFQVMAAAYARGAGAPPPASRYVDTLVVGSVVNLLCLQVLWQRPHLPPSRRSALRVLVGAWSVLFWLGLAGETYTGFAAELRPLAAFHYYSEQNLRNYLATGDEGYLRHPEIPYPSAATLKAYLEYPGLTSRLPVSARRPLALTQAGGDPGFVRYDGRVPNEANHRPRTGLGLAPGTPVLDNAIVWGSFGVPSLGGLSRWQSAPFVTARAEWLKFELAGNLGRSGTRLEVRDGATGRLAGLVTPDREPGPSWRSAWVKVPAGQWVLAAENSRAGTWFAFSEPIEMSTGSHAAWLLVRRGGWLIGAAGVLALGALVLPQSKS